MAHNVLLPKRNWKRCPNCGKKAKTIYHPNDKTHHSRTAESRVICYRCKKTFLIHFGGDFQSFANRKYEED